MPEPNKTDTKKTTTSSKNTNTTSKKPTTTPKNTNTATKNTKSIPGNSGTVNVTTKTNRNKHIERIDEIFDSQWLKTTFIITDSDIAIRDRYSKFIRKNRYYSTADYKFTSTSPGMNVAVNPKPQFTRYCDIRSKGMIKGRPDVKVTTRNSKYGLGMGRYYSEAIDDNQQRIFLRFGVPKYMPLLLWITKSFDIDKAVLQNRGVITSTLLEAINLISKFFAIKTAPLISLGMFMFNVYVQNSRFYSVKDTMYIYWSTVENILNQMVSRRTMVPYIFEDFSFRLDNTMNTEQSIRKNFVENLNKLLPDIIDAKTGRISVFAIALRAQKAFNKVFYEDIKRNKIESLSRDFTGYQDTGEDSHDTYFTNKKGQTSLVTEFLFERAYKLLIKDNKDQVVNLTHDPEQVEKRSLIEYDPIYLDKEGNPLTLSNDVKENIEQKIINNAKDKKSTFDKYKEYMLAELTEGAAFAVFNVEFTGSVGESFSNSVTDNPIETTFNAFSSKVRNISNFLSSATNIPIVQDILNLARDAGATVLSNASYGILNPLIALAYGVNVTMPKVWESSSASLPSATYKIKLISPYGNAYSQLFNIYLPLAMILAGSLPRSTGTSTYTSPFLCQLFDRGRVNIQMGIISNVSITRGTSNLAFSRAGHPNAIDVDITISNLDEVISVDVESTGILTRFKNQVDNLNFSDDPFTSYLNVITGVDVYTQIYRIPMIRLKLAERMMNIRAIINPDPAAFAAFTVDKVPFGSLIKEVIGNNQAALETLYRN